MRLLGTLLQPDPRRLPDGPTHTLKPADEHWFSGPMPPTSSPPPPAMGYQTANTMTTLELLAEAPRSVPELADQVNISVPAARRIMRRLAHDQYVERVPGDPIRRRYRVSTRGRALGARLVNAEQAVTPHRPAGSTR